MPRWRFDFDAGLDGAPASFAFDLAAVAHAPDETHPVRMQVRIPMETRTSEELAALEAHYIATLEPDGARFAGRVICANRALLYFYLPRADRPEDAPDIVVEHDEK